MVVGGWALAGGAALARPCACAAAMVSVHGVRVVLSAGRIVIRTLVATIARTIRRRAPVIAGTVRWLALPATIVTLVVARVGARIDARFSAAARAVAILRTRAVALLRMLLIGATPIAAAALIVPTSAATCFDARVPRVAAPAVLIPPVVPPLRERRGGNGESDRE